MLEAPPDPHTCFESANPRHEGRCDCGKRLEPSPLIGGRDPLFEQQFLREAQRLAGLPHTSFADEVEARLHRAERELGPDSYLQHSMHRLVSEINEEGLDVGGWATVAALAAYAKIADEEKRGRVQLLLQQLAAHGPLISRLCEQIHQELAD